MGEPFDETRSSTRLPDDQLTSWKDIASHFERDVTTVQRWEKREGMPVHRHLHDKIGSVYAFSTELDVWARSRSLKGSPDSANTAVAQDTLISRQPQSPPPSNRVRSFSLRVSVVVALGAVVASGAVLFVRETDYFWRNPIEGARFQTVTDFDGISRDAALSRDGHLVAFHSDHDGPMDVWVSQVGSGEFHNLTRGGMAELVNSSVRTLGFSPDSSLVTFWLRRPNGPATSNISIWAVPTLGGQPRPYLEGAAEFDRSHDGSRLAFHTPGPGDPLYVSDGSKRPATLPLFAAPPGLHSHFPVWSPDGAFLYFVQGSLPDNLDIWRIPAVGGAAERITSHFAYVSHPVLLDDRTLAYLAADRDGSGPWLYGMDIARRVPHRLTSGPERYTSLADSADGRRLVVTLASPKRTLWRLPIDPAAKTSVPNPIELTTNAGSFPRLGPDYLLYVSSTAGSESIWRLSNGTGTELWNAPASHIIAAPAISPDGGSIAFSVRQNSQSRLYVMQSDGTNLKLVTDSLDLQGPPAWAPNARSLTTAAKKRGVPYLFRVPLDGSPPVLFIKEYSVDPVWAPDDHLVIYSGPDIGTTFSLKAINPDGASRQIPTITLTRGARHVVFTSGGRSVALLRGAIQHKDLWLIDLLTGEERQLTRLPGDFDIEEFDISRDGREVVLERVQERSDIVLLELARH